MRASGHDNLAVFWREKWIQPEAMDTNDRRSALLLAIDLKIPSEGGATAIERDWPAPIDAFSDEDASKLEISIAS